MKTLNLETTAPFQGLAELVAYKDGLFKKENLHINWVAMNEDKKAIVSRIHNRLNGLSLINFSDDSHHVGYHTFLNDFFVPRKDTS